MTTVGWMLMLTSVSFVLLLTVYCFYKVLTTPDDGQQIHGPLDIKPDDIERDRPGRKQS